MDCVSSSLNGCIQVHVLRYNCIDPHSHLLYHTSCCGDGLRDTDLLGDRDLECTERLGDREALRSRSASRSFPLVSGEARRSTGERLRERLMDAERERERERRLLPPLPPLLSSARTRMYADSPCERTTGDKVEVDNEQAPHFKRISKVFATSFRRILFCKQEHDEIRGVIGLLLNTAL